MKRTLTFIFIALLAVSMAFAAYGPSSGGTGGGGDSPGSPGGGGGGGGGGGSGSNTTLVCSVGWELVDGACVKIALVAIEEAPVEEDVVEEVEPVQELAAPEPVVEAEAPKLDKDGFRLPGAGFWVAAAVAAFVIAMGVYLFRRPKY